MSAAQERPTVRVPKHDLTIGMAFQKGLLFKWRERAYDSTGGTLVFKWERMPTYRDEEEFDHGL